jgi:hypothetical protein
MAGIAITKRTQHVDMFLTDDMCTLDSDRQTIFRSSENLYIYEVPDEKFNRIMHMTTPVQ